MFYLVTSKLKLWALTLVGVLGAVSWAYLKGAKGAQDKKAAQEMKQYIEAKERMDEADHVDDADTAREWLQRYSSSRK